MFVSDKIRFPTGVMREVGTVASNPFAVEKLEERYELDVVTSPLPAQLPVIPYSRAMSSRQVNYPLEDLGLGKINWKKWKRAAGQMIVGAATGCATGYVGGFYGCLAGAAAGTYFGYNRRRKPLNLRQALTTAGYAGAAGGVVGTAVGYYRNEGIFTPKAAGHPQSQPGVQPSVGKIDLAPGQSIRVDPSTGQQYVVQGRVTDYSDFYRGQIDPEATYDKLNRIVSGGNVYNERMTPGEQAFLDWDGNRITTAWARGEDVPSPARLFDRLPTMPENIQGQIIASPRGVEGMVFDPKTGQWVKKEETWQDVIKDLGKTYLQVEAQKFLQTQGQGPAGPDFGQGGWGPGGTMGPGAGMPPTAGEMGPVGMPPGQGPMVMTADPMTGNPQGSLPMRMDPSATSVPYYAPDAVLNDNVPGGVFRQPPPTAETPWLTYALVTGGVVVAVIVGKKLWAKKKGRKAK